MIKKWISEALEYSNGTHSVDDVLDAINKGEMQLFANKGGCAVTTISQYPQKKVCFVFLVGGDLDSVLSIQPEVEKFAKSKDCEVLSMIGRLGWKKALKSNGWSSDSICMTRVL